MVRHLHPALSKSDVKHCLQAELICRFNTVEFCCSLKAPTAVISSHSMVPPLSNSKSCEITGSSQQKQLPCLFHCIPSLHPSLPIYSTQKCLPQRHHCWKVSCFCCLSLRFGHLAFSRRLGKRELLYLAQILTRRYCSSISHDLNTHERIYYTQSTKAGTLKWINFRERVTQVCFFLCKFF